MLGACGSPSDSSDRIRELSRPDPWRPTPGLSCIVSLLIRWPLLALLPALLFLGLYPIARRPVMTLGQAARSK